MIAIAGIDKMVRGRHVVVAELWKTPGRSSKGEADRIWHDTHHKACLLRVYRKGPDDEPVGEDMIK
jgi:rhodanese-related sulfurtransferase